MDVIKELKFLGKFTQKKIGGSGWGGGGRVGRVRVDVNEELKLLGKFTNKKFGGGGGGVGRAGGQVGRGSGWLGGQSGCERNVGGRG